MELIAGIVIVGFVIALFISFVAGSSTGEQNAEPADLNKSHAQDDDSLQSRLARMAAKPPDKRSELETMCLKMAAEKVEAMWVDWIFNSLSREEQKLIVAEYLDTIRKAISDYKGSDQNEVARMNWEQYRLSALYQEIVAAIEVEQRKSKKATSARQPSILSPPTSTPTVSEVMQQVPVAIRLATIENSIGMKLVLIPTGKFMLSRSVSEVVPRDIAGNVAELTAKGCPIDQVWQVAAKQFEQEMARWNRPMTQRIVTIASSFSLGVHEVTQSQYESVMGENPSRFKGANNPVERVSWDDAVAFCAKLSALQAEQVAGRVYRLPMYAEWEYACRAGTTTVYNFGDDATNLDKYAWFYDNSGSTSHAVGEKLPNGWGLFDMHGNVSEWCSDEIVGMSEWWSDASDEPVGGSRRVYRGGSRGCAAVFCSSAASCYGVPSYRDDQVGFRVALSSPSVQSPEADQSK